MENLSLIDISYNFQIGQSISRCHFLSTTKKIRFFFLEISLSIQNISLRKGNLCRRFKGEVIGTFCYICPRRRGDVLGGYNRGLKEKRPTVHRVSRHAKDSLVACY